MTQDAQTVCFIFDSEMEHIWLLRKKRGLFPGLLNGVGGKGEPEDCTQTATVLREMKEECGIGVEDINEFALIEEILFVETGITLSVYYAVLRKDANPRQNTDEALLKFKVSDVLQMDSSAFAGNGDVLTFVLESVHHRRAKIIE